MALDKIDFFVELTESQVKFVQSAIASMYSNFRKGRRKFSHACGFFAQRKEIESGKINFPSTFVVLNEDHIFVTPIGRLIGFDSSPRVSRTKFLGLTSRKFIVASLHWRAPNWVIRIGWERLHQKSAVTNSIKFKPAQIGISPKASKRPLNTMRPPKGPSILQSKSLFEIVIDGYDAESIRLKNEALQRIERARARKLKAPNARVICAGAFEMNRRKH